MGVIGFRSPGSTGFWLFLHNRAPIIGEVDVGRPFGNLFKRLFYLYEIVIAYPTGNEFVWYGYDGQIGIKLHQICFGKPGFEL